MGAAYKCDLTGEVQEGAGVAWVEVDVRDGVRVRALVMVQSGHDAWGEGVLGPKGAAQLAKLLAPIAAKKVAG